MLGTFLSKAETGEFATCGVCHQNNLDEYYSLNPNDDQEYNFLEDKFGDHSNWCICDRCTIKFAKLIGKKGFSFWFCGSYFGKNRSPYKFELKSGGTN